MLGTIWRKLRGRRLTDEQHARLGRVGIIAVTDDPANDLMRVFEMGKHEGRREEQAQMLEAMQEDRPRPSERGYVVNLVVDLAISCIERGQVAEAKRLLEDVRAVLTPPSIVKPMAAEELAALIRSGALKPAGNWMYKKPDGTQHLFEAPGDMARESLKDMAPADRIKALREAGIQVDGNVLVCTHTVDQILDDGTIEQHKCDEAGALKSGEPLDIDWDSARESALANVESTIARRERDKSERLRVMAPQKKNDERPWVRSRGEQWKQNRRRHGR